MVYFLEAEGAELGDIRQGYSSEQKLVDQLVLQVGIELLQQLRPKEVRGDHGCIVFQKQLQQLLDSDEIELWEILALQVAEEDIEDFREGSHQPAEELQLSQHLQSLRSTHCPGLGRRDSPESLFNWLGARMNYVRQESLNIDIRLQKR